jgi:maleate cis-trans isomerase
VRALRGLGIRDEHEIGGQSPETAYRLAREVDGPDVDCLFVSCTNFPALLVIAALKADTGKPVVTGNQATIWHTLRRAGVGARSAASDTSSNNAERGLSGSPLPPRGWGRGGGAGWGDSKCLC